MMDEDPATLYPGISQLDVVIDKYCPGATVPVLLRRFASVHCHIGTEVLRAPALLLLLCLTAKCFTRWQTTQYLGRCSAASAELKDSPPQLLSIGGPWQRRKEVVNLTHLAPQICGRKTPYGTPSSCLPGCGAQPATGSQRRRC
eukprot:COSAG01_NODE_26143_length_722_cov_1.735152_1_plen_143_part_10